MKVVNYECSMCEKIWAAENSFGVNVEETKTTLVEPEDSEKHICRNCLVAIRDFGKDED